MVTTANMLRAEGRKQGRQEGRTEEAANAVLTVLSARGLACSKEDEATIRACTDQEQLGLWLRRAATCSSVTEVLAAK